MNIHRLFLTDVTFYSSELGSENLLMKIRKVLDDQHNGISGRVMDNMSFTAFHQMNVIGWSMPGLKRKSAYLSAEILDEEKGSIIRMKTAPNAVLSLFSIVAFTLGLSIILYFISHQLMDNTVLLFGLVMILLSIAYSFSAKILRDRLKNRLAANLGLRKSGE